MQALAEIAAERAQQDARCGQQNHPDGTGDQLRELARPLDESEPDVIEEDDRD
jgi:hypothetical protein